MHLRITKFTLKQGVPRSKFRELVDLFDPLLRERKGFISITYFGNDDTRQYGSMAIWETKNDVEEASSIIFPQVQERLVGIIDGPPSEELLDVIEPS